MLCEKCNKNEATFYYHENINGNEKTYNLCGECAKNMEQSGELPKSGSHFGDIDSVFADFANPFKSMDKLFANFFGDTGALTSGKSQIREEKKCPCGMTLRQFAAQGLAGCPACYETFESELEPSITRVHGRTVHEGRSPSKFREKLDKKKKIEALEKERAEAIKNENYERAAEIRDMLKDMRSDEKGE